MNENATPTIIDIEAVEQAMGFLATVNELPLTAIEWRRGGVAITIEPEVIAAAQSSERISNRAFAALVLVPHEGNTVTLADYTEAVQ